MNYRCICDSQAFEFIEYRAGEMTWRCMDCGEFAYDFIDCTGGR